MEFEEFQEEESRSGFSSRGERIFPVPLFEALHRLSLVLGRDS